MPTTNRPFFSNFLAAFRTHSALQKTTPSNSSVLTPAVSTAFGSTTPPTSPTSPSNPRPITTKAGAHHHHGPYEATSPQHNPATVAAAQAAAATFRSSRPVGPPASSAGTAPARAHSASRIPHHSSSPLPLPVALPHGSHSSSSPYNDGCWSPVAVSPPSPFQARSRTPSLTRKTARPRRGSDSSSEGGWGTGGMTKGDGGLGAAAEKWYIGGRTAGGEERFYKLGLVRRYESADRLSVDRLSI